jgi:hypothetical protein
MQGNLVRLGDVKILTGRLRGIQLHKDQEGGSSTANGQFNQQIWPTDRQPLLFLCVSSLTNARYWTNL